MPEEKQGKSEKKAKVQQTKAAAYRGSVLEEEMALPPQQQGMSPSWRSFYAAVKKSSQK